MAPDIALGRNEETKGRKPVLIDEMFKRHRRRMDGVIDVMDALLVRRIDAERMQSGLVLCGRDDLALRERGRQAPFIGNNRQICRSRRGATRTPSLDTGSASRRRRRKFRNGVRTASRQAACSDRLIRTSFSFSIRSRATLLRWVSDKSRSAPMARANARLIQPRVYARTRRQRQGRPYPPRSGPPT